MTNSTPDSKYLKLLESQNWASILEELGIHAGIYYRRLPPKEREELIHQAIEKVYTGEQPWDNDKRPDLLAHLKWVLKSVNSNEFKLSYNQKRVGSFKNHEGILIDPLDSIPDKKPLPDEALDVKMLIRQIHEAVKGDEEAELILMAYEDGAGKPAEVAIVTGYDVKTVNKALKRIRRRWPLINQ